ncbi:hypothetical protein [Nevskia ramosa]|uniref:hypothetical protein n=1 Tax=Nevskia ramosa TaxID=64002 RepID=UPI003D1030B4
MPIGKNSPILARTARIAEALTPKPVFDSVAAIFDAAEAYAASDAKMKVASMLQEFAATSDADLDEGETFADRLFALLIGCVDADKNGELDDDENEMLVACMESAWDYLSSKGVSDEDIGALLNDGDPDAAMRVIEMLNGVMEDMGDDGQSEDMDAFAFGGDGETMDAAYKKVTAFRKGKKVRINKRVSGTVRLSAKQKMSIRKALRKAGGARAMMRRKRTNNIRKKSGM